MNAIEHPFLLNFEEYLIDSSFSANYSYFKNQEKYNERVNYLINWVQKPDVAPVDNLILKEVYDNGVKLGRFENASVCIEGESDYLMFTPSGIMTQTWKFGYHNVDHGLGYIPTDGHVKEFKTNYTLCCIVPNKDKNKDIVYNFEILDANNTIIDTNKKYEWVHVAYGSVSYNGTTYNQKQTIYELSIHSQLNAINTFIGIAGYLN